MNKYKDRQRMKMKPTFKDKLVAEALDFYKIDSMLDADDEFLDDLMMDEPDGSPELDDTDLEAEFSDDMDFDLDAESGMDFDDDGMDFDAMDYNSGESDSETPEEGGPNERGNEGLIRTVKGAYMVYKRVTDSNNYEELWIYNMKDVKTQTKIRNSILAGTDIDPVTLRSPDGEQSASIYSKGNVQYLEIDGLPN